MALCVLLYVICMCIHVQAGMYTCEHKGHRLRNQVSSTITFHPDGE